MIMKREIQFGLAVIAFLAVTAAGSLFWFNWWLRFGTTRIYPLCFDGESLIEFNDPLTPEANAMFHGNMMPFNVRYAWVEDEKVIAKNWCWLFGEAEIYQRTKYHFLEELAKYQGLDPERYHFCGDLAVMGTPSH
jgi:hypothetical protein